ncbi:MAG: methyltransferase [Oscillospiraceae bacterium]|nr:methyltransferase [Oscillospiraceae bacterium]
MNLKGGLTLLTPRQNVMAVLNGQQPDYYGDLMPTLQFISDPVFLRDRIPQDGKIHQDSWGTSFCFLPGSPGSHPVVNSENAVIKDIEKWEESLVVPTLKDLDWSLAIEQAKSVNREEKFCAIYSSGGLFERTHHLMGMQEALMNYMEYPEEMAGILRKIADFKIEYIKLAAKYLQPDIIFYHDDWGTKQNLFLPPRVWRELIKPLQAEIAQTLRDCNIIYMHHADCVCQPIVEDMVEIGVEIWQGAIPQNDIVEIQRITKGKLPMIGGIDGPKIDIENITEEQIRAEVRRAFDTYIPGGPFFPSIANGCCFRKWNNDIYLDELARYGKVYAQEHPVK